MVGFFPDKAKELLGIPQGFEPVAAVRPGYQSDPALLPERLRQRELAPREREPLGTLVFSGQWDKPLPMGTDR
jgi:hypothetical protein